MDSEKNIISDCKGTCKTPIGCTCGRQTPVETSIEEETVVVVEKRKEPRLIEKTEVCSPRKNCCCYKKNHKLEVYDWLNDLPEAYDSTKMIEVQFKNTRKGYYLNSNDLELFKGDIVAVEASPGHDIGEVTLTGKLVLLQMKKTNYRPQQGEHKRVYRVAKQSDIDKYNEAKSREHKTMLRSREIAEELGLNMKISDVEYQGDGNKAIFYYIADERVDFRQLIKVYAEKFHVKIEMKQIGARQEAGRVGGIGPCGRELCCSSSMASFISVSTSAARFQDISLNPQKLAGQCGKLKCCLNYEVDTYVEAQRELPSREIQLETKDSTYYHFKTDILTRTLTYSTSKDFPANLVSIDKDRAFEIIRMNRKGKRPLNLALEEEHPTESPVAIDILAQENINRFDDSKKKRPQRNKNHKGGNNNRNNRNPEDAANNKRGEVIKKVRDNNNTREANAQLNQRNNGEGDKGDRPNRNNNNRNRNRNRNTNNNRPNNNKGEKRDEA